MIPNLFSNIFIYDEKLLNHTECDSIIELANSIGLTQSTVTSNDGYTNKVLSSHRTNYNLNLPYGKYDIIDDVYRHIAKIISLPVENIEMEINRYSDGQYFMAHYDYLTSEWIVDTGGQRLYSCVVYLNDDFEGGETHFANLGKTIKPIKGNAVLWKNCLYDSDQLDLTSLHESLPIISGTKWALIVWVRENAFKSKHYETSSNHQLK